MSQVTHTYILAVDSASMAWASTSIAGFCAVTEELNRFLMDDAVLRAKFNNDLDALPEDFREVAELGVSCECWCDIDDDESEDEANS